MVEPDTALITRIFRLCWNIPAAVRTVKLLKPEKHRKLLKVPTGLFGLWLCYEASFICLVSEHEDTDLLPIFIRSVTLPLIRADQVIQKTTTKEFVFEDR